MERERLLPRLEHCAYLIAQYLSGIVKWANAELNGPISESMRDVQKRPFPIVPRVEWIERVRRGCSPRYRARLQKAVVSTLELLLAAINARQGLGASGWGRDYPRPVWREWAEKT